MDRQTWALGSGFNLCCLLWQLGKLSKEQERHQSLSAGLCHERPIGSPRDSFNPEDYKVILYLYT